MKGWTEKFTLDQFGQSKFYDENGEVQTISDDMMRRELALHDALEASSAAVDDISEFVENLDESSTIFGILSGDMSNAVVGSENGNWQEAITDPNQKTKYKTQLIEYTEKYSEAFNGLTYDAAESLSNLFGNEVETYVSTLSDSQKQALNETVKNADISTPEGIKRLQEEINNIDPTIDADSFIAEIAIMQNSVDEFDASKFNEQLKKAQSSLDGITFGSIKSTEDLQNAHIIDENGNIGEEFLDDWIALAGGEYKYVGSETDLDSYLARMTVEWAEGINDTIDANKTPLLEERNEASTEADNYADWNFNSNVRPTNSQFESYNNLGGENFDSANIITDEQIRTIFNEVISKYPGLNGDLSNLSDFASYDIYSGSMIYTNGMNADDYRFLNGYILDSHFNSNGNGIEDYIQYGLSNTSTIGPHYVSQTDIDGWNAVNGYFAGRENANERLEQAHERLEQAQAALDEFNNNPDNQYQTPFNQYIDLDKIKEWSQESSEYLDDYEKQVRSAAEATAELFGVGGEAVQEFANYLNENNEYLQDSYGDSYRVAAVLSIMSKSLTDLNSNWENWNTILNSGNEDSLEYAQTIEALSKDLQGLLNGDEAPDENFIKDNLEDIALAADGDIEAINRLKIVYAQASLLSNTGASDAEHLSSELLNVYNLLSEIDTTEIKFGVSMDATPVTQALFDMLQSIEISAEAAQDILDRIGYEAVVRQVGDKVVIENAHYAGASRRSIPQVKKTGSNKSGGSRQKKDKKDYDDEFERYYKITRQIKDQEDALTRLGKAKDRAFGAAKLKYIEQESDVLAKEMELQQQYLSEIEDYYLKDQANLNAFGATYDENGVLTNYDQIVKAQVDAYNAAVDKYNAGGSEADFDVAQQKYDYFKEVLKQYDETNQLYQEQQDKLQDLKNQWYDKQLEHIQTELEIKIEVNDDALKLIEYRLDRIKEKSFSTAEALKESLGQLDLQVSKQKAYQTSIDEILGNHGVSMESIKGLSNEEIANLGFTEDEVKALRDGIDRLLDSQKAIDEIQNAIIDGPLTVMKEWNDEFDRLNGKIEHSAKIIQSYRNISDLTRSNTGLGSDFMLGLQRQQYGVSINNVQGSRTEYEANKRLYEEAKRDYEAAVASGADANTLDRLKRNLHEMEEITNQSQEQMLANLEAALKEAQELLQATVDKAKEAFEAMTSATGSMEFDDTIFDHMERMDDAYLDDYEKIYQFSKLTRDINKSMANESSADNMNRYREVLEEIQRLEESGEEVTEYQVEALRKKYELAQAYANLQDSQNAKSTVRMSRDADGNMSYIYSGGENEDALQQYENKLYEYQKLNSDYVKEQQKNFRDLQKEASETFAKIAADTTLTPEEKEERINEARAFYEEMGVTITEQMGLALQNNQQLYDGYWQWYSDKYDYAISKQGEFQTAFEYTHLGKMYEDLPTSQSLYEQFFEAMVGEEGYIPLLTAAWQQYAIDQSEALEAAEIDIENFAGFVEGAVGAAGTAAQEATGEIEDASGRMIEEFEKVRDVFDIMNDLNLDGMRDAITDGISSLNDMIGKYSEAAKAAEDAQKRINTAVANTQTFTPNVSNTGTTTTTNPTDYTTSPGTTGGVPSGVYQAIGHDPDFIKNNVKDITKFMAKFAEVDSKNTSGFKTTAGSYGRIPTDAQNALWNSMNTNEKVKGVVEANLSKFAGLGIFKSFDTGGYTGAWNSGSGKLAMLHEKELVLNKQDTENMLKMVDIARSVINSNGLQNELMNYNNSIKDEIMNISNKNDMQQNVHIEATFTDATTREEITAAFDSLINRATQYAGRKKC